MLNRENTFQTNKDKIIEEYNGIKIQELPFVNKINMRIDPNNKDYMSACSKILETK